MEFEVASIRPADPSAPLVQPGFGLNTDDAPIPPGGRFLAEFPIEIYIDFAYKIMPTEAEREIMLSRSPAWVSKEQFVIQARADGNPTKDQMRLMMQSLLADRCKLTVHFERREVPILALVQAKPGKLVREASLSRRRSLLRRKVDSPCGACLTIHVARSLHADLQLIRGDRRPKPLGDIRGAKYPSETARIVPGDPA